MRKFLAIFAFLMLVARFDAGACTNVIITPGASKDGSSIVSYAADSHQLYGELYFHPAARFRAGSMLRLTDWDTQRPLGFIDQVPSTYQTVGNMNQHQLIIAETTWGGRSELFPDENADGIDYGSLIYVTLQRARTAREAIDIIVSLANEYGYVSEGETFSIADTKEAWIMDIVGKGVDRKGVVWVARRIPDGYICAHANQARITRFPLNDKSNCLYAP
ncbi:MAG TPA: dipeptidase, partial [Rikenellaceae bacterium]|nr:dipeptidase [Rikenellaceae bacterium]